MAPVHLRMKPCTVDELLDNGTEDAKRCVDFAENLSMNLLNPAANDCNRQFAD